MNAPAANDRSALNFLNILATLVALAGAGGTLWLSISMGLKACPLCLYQRAFVMAAAGVFVVGLFTSYRGSSLLHFLALPAVVGGLGVAIFHVYLEWNGTLECPVGVADIGSAPQQSLALFALLTLVVMLGVFRSCKIGECEGVASIAAILLGAAFAYGTIKSAPPLPAAPTAPYDTPLLGCRPAYHAE